MDREQQIAEALFALAKAEMKTPEGRARMARVLQRTLREVGEPLDDDVATALDDIAAHLLIAGDHAAFVAERTRGRLMASALQG